MAAYDVTDDSDLRTRVRKETQYDDTADELPDADLNELIGAAKHEMEVRTGSTNWYSDQSLALALVGLVCIKAKNAVENYSVSAWDVLGQTINVTGAGDEDASQFQQWSGMMETGLSKSTETSEGDLPTGIVSNSYLG